jgi:hypothetical protein
MADLLQAGAAWLGGVLRDHASQSVTYRRGGGSVDLTATIGQTRYEEARSDGLVEQHVAVDFLVAVGDLVIDGSPVTPVRGDRIDWTTGGTTRTYQVLPLPDNRVYSTDAYYTRYRVHTKLESDGA